MVAMTRRFIGVRWWLGAAFAVVAATSTAIVVSQFSTRSENAFRGKAEELAAASAFDAAKQVDGWARRGRNPLGLARIAKQQNLELHVYDRAGRRTQVGCGSLVRDGRGLDHLDVMAVGVLSPGRGRDEKRPQRQNAGEHVTGHQVPLSGH